MSPVASRLKLRLCSWAVAALAVSAAAGSGTQAVAQLTVKLQDGSRISGVPSLAGLPFHTEYARTDIPWSSVAGCSVSTSNEPCLLRLKNGDQLRGRIGFDKIKLDTAFGQLTVAAADISALSVRQGAAGGGPEGLILYFPFDEDGGDVVRDASGSGNDGKVLGAQFTPDGKMGGAYKFNGDEDCITVSNVEPFDRLKDMTVCAWIKLREFKSDFGGVVSRRTPGDLWWLGVKTGFGVEVNMDGVRNRGSRSTGGDSIQKERWYFICFTYEAGISRTIYINGSEADSLQMNGVLPRSSSIPVRIGRGYNTAETFDGLIDEVMIFNRALPAEEVQALYQRGGLAAPVAVDVKTGARRGAAACKVRADLMDGSVLVGEIKAEELGFRSATLGKVSVPLAQVRELKFSEEGQTVAATLRNGDVLIGTPLFADLKVTTAFGPVVLLPAHVRVLIASSEKQQAPPDLKKQPEF